MPCAVIISRQRSGSQEGTTVTNFRRKRRLGRRSVLACESLEGRVVLTYAGSSSLLGSLSYVGVVTSPIESASVPILPILPVLPTPIIPFSMGRASSAYSQLRTDLQTLRTELQTLAGKSGATIEDLQNLTSDSQTIAQAGFYFEAKSLNPVISELAVAVAGGTSTSQAQTDWGALFSGSSVTQATITSTFTDLTRTIKDSAVTTSDLSTVAADEAAIQTDLSKLPFAWVPVTDPWLDQVGATPGALSLAPAVVSPAAVASSTAAALAPIPLPPIIVSPFGGGSLSGALSSVGVVTSPVTVLPTLTVLPPFTVPPSIAATATALPLIPATTSGAYSQLRADVQKLQTELQSLASKSGLTIADLQKLANDSQAINQAGFFFNAQSLDKTVSELATAVAAGASTAQAQTDFTALFSGSSVSTTTINTAFSDLTKAIQDSKVLPADLTTVAADQAAIQADWKNLFPGKGGGTGTGTGTGTGSGAGTSSGSTGSGSTGSIGGHKTTTKAHKGHHSAHVVIKIVKTKHTKKLSRLKKR
jgi:chaperonin cofactor prefoldin